MATDMEYPEPSLPDYVFLVSLTDQLNDLYVRYSADLDDLLFHALCQRLERSDVDIDGLRLLSTTLVGYGDSKIFALRTRAGEVEQENYVVISFDDFERFSTAVDHFVQAVDEIVLPLLRTGEYHQVHMNYRTCTVEIYSSGKVVWRVADAPATLSEMAQAIRVKARSSRPCDVHRASPRGRRRHCSLPATDDLCEE